MQNDLDYERAWDKVSKQFWRKAWRALTIHTALFAAVHIFLIIDPQSISTFTRFPTAYGPLIFLRQLGFQDFPWITLNWGIFLAAHILVLIGMGLSERMFRYRVEHELLRDFAKANRMDEKRKMRPAYPAYNELSDHESGLEVMDEADEAPYRQSAR